MNFNHLKKRITREASFINYIIQVSVMLINVIPRAADGDLLAPGINLRLRDAKNTSNFAAEMIYSLFIS